MFEKVNQKIQKSSKSVRDRGGKGGGWLKTKNKSRVSLDGFPFWEEENSLLIISVCLLIFCHFLQAEPTLLSGNLPKHYLKMFFKITQTAGPAL